MRRRFLADQLLYDLKIERTAWRNNNIRRRVLKEAQEVSSTTIESTTNFSYQAYIQPSNHKEEVDMAKEGEGKCTLGDYATFMGPLNFNSIARPTIIATNMEMKSTLIHLV